MSGTKITAAISITPKVVWLEDASQTVRLLLGSREEGRMKGNMLTPAVATTPATLSALAIQAKPSRRPPRVKAAASSAPRTATSGASMVKGKAL